MWADETPEWLQSLDAIGRAGDYAPETAALTRSLPDKTRGL
jgi:hypothetical protein